MADPRFQSATALLFDPEPSMRQITRSGLLNIGFGDVVACSDRYEFIEIAKSGEFDLILAETAVPGADIHHVVQDIRNHRIGHDPFVNVVLFLWNSAPDVVSEVINAGADDLITRPMSRKQIYTRLERLIAARKPFIVTADYFGPDRRNTLRSAPTTPTMVVPNSLQAKVENRPELAATPEAISFAMKAVNERKISIYTEQLMRLSSAVILLSGSADSFEDRKGVVTVMQERNKALAERVMGTEFAHIISLCDALNEILKSVADATPPLADKDRELLSQIPYAIHKGCMEVHHTASLAFDIRDVSERLRDTRIGPKTSGSLNNEKISLTLG